MQKEQPRSADFDAVDVIAEKFRDKYEAAETARGQLPAAQHSRIRFVLADVNDTHLVSLLEGCLTGNMSTGWGPDSAAVSNGADGLTSPAAGSENGGLATKTRNAGRPFDSLLIFCNNVAFNEGTIHRCRLPFAPPLPLSRPKASVPLPQHRLHLMPTGERAAIRDFGSQRRTGQSLHPAACLDWVVHSTQSADAAGLL